MHESFHLLRVADIAVAVRLTLFDKSLMLHLTEQSSVILHGTSTFGPRPLAPLVVGMFNNMASCALTTKVVPAEALSAAAIAAEGEIFSGNKLPFDEAPDATNHTTGNEDWAVALSNRLATALKCQVYTTVSASLDLLSLHPIRLAIEKELRAVIKAEQAILESNEPSLVESTKE